MEKAKWSESLSIGNYNIDKQHQNIIDLTNKLMDHSTAHVKAEIISETLRDLLMYYKAHFQEEEALLIDIKYPDIDKHKKMHDGFKYKVAMFTKDVMNLKPDVVSEMIQFLSNWFIHHISTADQDYKKYL